MIAEVAAIVGGIGAVTGWIAAYAARGKTIERADAANKEAERARAAEARAAAITYERDTALANEQTIRAEFKASEAAFQMLRSERDRIVEANSQLLRKLADAGIAVGSAVVDGALDGLFPNADRREAGAGTGDRAPDPGSSETVPDGDPAAAGDRSGLDEW